MAARDRPGLTRILARPGKEQAEKALDAARISGKMSGDMPADSGPGRQPEGGNAAHTCLALVRLLMAGLSGLLVLGALSCSSAQGNSAPPWKLHWADNFNGPAGSGVNPKYWEYNTGQGSFGTNEVETMTSSPENVHLDGHGNLVITALGHGAAGSPGTAWTSGRVETRPTGCSARRPAAR